MEIFLDSTSIEDIEFFANLGIISGVTTNPSLILSENKKPDDIIATICKIPNLKSVSYEVVGNTFEEMKQQASKIIKAFPQNITIKIPMTFEGLKLSKYLSDREVKTNITLCFSTEQMLLAALTKPTYISIFVGRLEDVGADGFEEIAKMRHILDENQNVTSKILAASIRNVHHITRSFVSGAHTVTTPASALYKMIEHPLTKSGLEKFNKDWENVKKGGFGS